MPSIYEHVEQLRPEFLPFTRLLECGGIADHDEAIACTREEHVQAFRGVHESDVSGIIASCERNNDNVTLLALVVICLEIVRLEDQQKRRIDLYRWWIGGWAFCFSEQCSSRVNPL